jgi:hypothetical protein
MQALVTNLLLLRHVTDCDGLLFRVCDKFGGRAKRGFRVQMLVAAARALTARPHPSGFAVGTIVLASFDTCQLRQFSLRLVLFLQVFFLFVRVLLATATAPPARYAAMVGVGLGGGVFVFVKDGNVGEDGCLPLSLIEQALLRSGDF